MTWLFAAMLSALLSATAAVLQKQCLRTVTALRFAFLLAVSTCLLSSVLLIGVELPAPDPAPLLVLAGKSLIGGIAFLLVMAALERGEISRVLPLLGLTPAVTAVFSFVLTGERMHGTEWGAVTLMMMGLFILEWRPGNADAVNVGGTRGGRPHLLIVGALVLFALSSVGDKVLVSGFRMDLRIVLVFQHIVFCLLFGAMLMVRRTGLRVVLEEGRRVLPVIVLIAVVTIGYRYAQLAATVEAPVALVLAVKRTSILFASLVGGRIFADERLPVRLAGAAMIVGAGFLILRNVG